MYLVSLFATIALTSACGSNTEKQQTTTDTTASKPAAETSKTAGLTVDNLMDNYIKLKNALADDNGNLAATAAEEITATLGQLDLARFTADQKKIYEDVSEDMKEHAAHIKDNAGNLAHQREHFDILSKDVIELVEVTGSAKALYRNFCPMYNDKKGAYWLSEVKEIRNPYYGKEMLECGEVKGEIKARE
jgi:hypothetical protein